MNPHNTPTSRRSRSCTPQNPNIQPSQDPNQGFSQGFQDPNQAYSQGFQAYSQSGPYGFAQPAFQPYGISHPGFQPYPQPGIQPYPTGGFQNLLHHGIGQSSQPGPYRENPPEDHSSPFNLNDDDSEDDDDDDDEEVVPETQPPPQAKGKKFKTRAKRQVWSKQEEVALAKAFIDVSEDPVVGNACDKRNFWKRVLHVFNINTNNDKERTVHQVNSKYKKVNCEAARFGAIYNNLINTRSSGQSEANILELAYSRYEERYKKAFIHHHVWDIFKSYPKWEAVPPCSARSSCGSKRTATTDDDIRQEDGGRDVDVVEVQRPVGRDRAKRVSRGSSSSTATPKEWLDGVNKLKDSIEHTTDYRMQKLAFDKEKFEFEKQLKLKQQLDDDIKYYLSPHEHLTGAELQFTLWKKQQLKQQYGWDF